MIYRKLRKALEEGIIKASPGLISKFNNARLAYPARVYHGAGGIGDDLLCTCIFRELKKRGETNIVIRSNYGELFRNSPDVNSVIRKKIPFLAPIAIYGLNMFQLTYFPPLKEHFLASMCRMAGISGEVTLRPYLFLQPKELAAGRRYGRQIVVQSAGFGAKTSMKNKEWFPDRFQEVADRLQPKASLIQLGTPTDPPLKGALDLRGKTSLREAAAILANSAAFVGQVGFLMHLARAVDCRSVIVYGGRETPETTGYTANRNLVGTTQCSPCWEENKCEYDRECMRMITVDTVVRAVKEQIERQGTPLEAEIVEL